MMAKQRKALRRVNGAASEDFNLSFLVGRRKFYLLAISSSALSACSGTALGALPLPSLLATRLLVFSKVQQ